ncbi:MAG: hypothetical protein JJU12_02745 [Chlamydiales bacterium]|nr:hypothetical protein [Chlamydiales bacterium]
MTIERREIDKASEAIESIEDPIVKSQAVLKVVEAYVKEGKVRSAESLMQSMTHDQECFIFFIQDLVSRTKEFEGANLDKPHSLRIFAAKALLKSTSENKIFFPDDHTPILIALFSNFLKSQMN